MSFMNSLTHIKENGFDWY